MNRQERRAYYGGFFHLGLLPNYYLVRSSCLSVVPWGAHAECRLVRELGPVHGGCAHGCRDGNPQRVLPHTTSLVSVEHDDLSVHLWTTRLQPNPIAPAKTSTCDFVPSDRVPAHRTQPGMRRIWGQSGDRLLAKPRLPTQPTWDPNTAFSGLPEPCRARTYGFDVPTSDLTLCRLFIGLSAISPARGRAGAGRDLVGFLPAKVRDAKESCPSSVTIGRAAASQGSLGSSRGSSGGRARFVFNLFLSCSRDGRVAIRWRAVSRAFKPSSKLCRSGLGECEGTTAERQPLARPLDFGTLPVRSEFPRHGRCSHSLAKQRASH